MAKKKNLVKCKIVLEDDGRTLTTYFWRKTFWIFGEWYPFGVSSTMGNGQNSSQKKRAEDITDDSVSKVLFNNFIK
jgi:hypothetical protein